jgi:hypothetical protein
LTRLHPTLVIPPIPEKHTMADYAANPTSAKQDQQIIDLRKRMLMVFLNRCRRMDAVREDGVWWRFLDPNSSWVMRSLFSRYKYDVSSVANVTVERGLTCPPCCFHSQVCSQGTSIRHRESNPSAQLSSNSLQLIKTQGLVRYRPGPERLCHSRRSACDRTLPNRCIQAQRIRA